MNIDYVLAPILLLLSALLVVILAFRSFQKLHARALGGFSGALKRSALVLIALLFVIVAASSTYNAVRIHLFWAKHPAPGEMVTINGHRMHLNCSGSGNPTVILDAGLGNEAVNWANVQSLLARSTRVCSYDRAGFGWSEPSSAPADADHIASDLHELITKTGITGPLILVGHSLAGLYIRDYATHYPAGVEGLVFVDATSPLQEQDAAYKRTTTHGPPSWLLHMAMIAGVPRMIHMCSPRAKHPTDVQLMQSEAYCRIHYPSIEKEADNLTVSGQETVHTGPYEFPLLILSHDPESNLPLHPRPDDRAHEEAWSRLQENLTQLSSKSGRVIVQGTSHSMITQRPEVIAKLISQFADEVRHSGHQADGE